MTGRTGHHLVELLATTECVDAFSSCVPLHDVDLVLDAVFGLLLVLESPQCVCVLQNLSLVSFFLHVKCSVDLQSKVLVTVGLLCFSWDRLP